MALDGFASVAAAAVTVASAAVAGWWACAFWKLLPAQRDLRRRTAELDAARLFATRLVDAETLASRPAHALIEAADRAAEALTTLHPRLAHAIVARRPDGAVSILAHRGGPWARVPLAVFRFEEGLLARAGNDGGALWEPSASAERDPLVEALAAHGAVAAAACGWQSADGSAAVLSAQFGEGDSVSAAREDLAMAASALRSAVAIIDGVAHMAETSQRLQGGLSAAISELSRTHERLIKKSRVARGLQDVAGAMASRASRDAVSLGAIVSIVARALAADCVVILTFDEASAGLVVQPGAHGLSGAASHQRIPMSDAASPVVRAFSTRKPCAVADAVNSGAADLARAWDVVSLLAVPLVIDDHAVGVLCAGSRSGDSFDDDSAALTAVLAGEASILVETAVLNRRLAETTERLSTLNRMKDDFVSTVSHEFKTPLTTIVGFIGVLLDGDAGPLNEEQMNFLQKAKGAARRLTSLVSDLLDLSRLEGGAKMDLRPTDVGEIVTVSVADHLPMAAEGGKTVRWAPPERLPQGLADERWLMLVLDNLISNAIKFTRKGGAISIAAADRGDFILIEVADDGIGIPAIDREKIFERFYRASNRGLTNAPGTGLGLAIARDVVSKHGGKIWVESEPGRGSTFRFVIPTSRADDRS